MDGKPIALLSSSIASSFVNQLRTERLRVLASTPIRTGPVALPFSLIAAVRPRGGNLSFFRGKRGTDLALVVVMLSALEQLVPDAIARLEHAC